MPGRPAKPCVYPGCTALVRDGSRRCAAHPFIKWAKGAAAPDAARLRGRKNQQRRQRLWMRSPFCAMCGKRLLLSECEIDHRRPMFMGGSDDDANCQVLCGGFGGCHASKTAAEQKR